MYCEGETQWKSSTGLTIKMTGFKNHSAQMTQSHFTAELSSLRESRIKEKLAMNFE